MPQKQIVSIFILSNYQIQKSANMIMPNITKLHRKQTVLWLSSALITCQEKNIFTGFMSQLEIIKYKICHR